LGPFLVWLNPDDGNDSPPGSPKEKSQNRSMTQATTKSSFSEW